MIARTAVTGATLMAGVVAAGLSRRRLRDQLAITQELLAAANRRLAEAETAALTDNLTGAANRTWLEAELAHRAAGTAPFSVMLLDLDGFKTVNDTPGLGHEAGDQALVEAAHRLTSVTANEHDVVGRLGGDEFLILVTGGEAVARLVADRVCAAMRTPIQIDDTRQVWVTASVGLVHAVPGDDVRALLHSADAAMYGAKRAGGDRVAEYEACEPLAAVVPGRPKVRLRELRRQRGLRHWNIYNLAGAAR